MLHLCNTHQHIKFLVRKSGKFDCSIPDNLKGSPYTVDLSISTNQRTRMYTHDWQDTSRIFYSESFSSLIDSIGEKHGETAFNPLGGFHLRFPDAFSTLPTTNRCNETPVPTLFRIETPTSLRG